jgi:hypothetical protein
VFLYVVALILGIIYTIRKLDVRRREPEHFPHVNREAFLAWKQTELVAYNVAIFASFTMIFIDFGFSLLASRVGMNWNLVRVVGFSIFASWVAAVVWAMFRASAGRRLRAELGIDLAAPPPAEAPGGRSDGEQA